MDIIAQAAVAGESSEDELVKLLVPSETREEMDAVFTEYIGYSPRTYHDEQDIKSILDRMKEVAPEDAAGIMTEKEDEIVKKTLSTYEEEKVERFEDILSDIITDFTGWSPREDSSDDSDYADYDDSYEDDEYDETDDIDDEI